MKVRLKQRDNIRLRTQQTLRFKSDRFDGDCECLHRESANRSILSDHGVAILELEHENVRGRNSDFAERFVAMEKRKCLQ